MPLHFFSDGITFRFRNIKKHREWILNSLRSEKKISGDINIIFCSDQYLRKINRKFLQRENYTDVITFSNSDDKRIISGDVFISVGRVKENSRQYYVSFTNELRRMIIHGILHLCGYDDKTKAEIRKMRRKEDIFLSRYLEAKSYFDVLE